MNLYAELAILDNAGYKQHDETLVDALAGGLYAFIKDNPEVFKG